jgi:hypothetical protein
VFTKHILFKLLATVGVGSVWPTQAWAKEFRPTTSAPYSSAPVHQTSSDILPTIRDSLSVLSDAEQWEDLLDDLDAVELIGRYTSLRSADDESRNSKGPCPFCRQGPDSLLLDGLTIPISAPTALWAVMPWISISGWNCLLRQRRFLG